MKRTIIDASHMELNDNVVTIKRVTKVVKGGRNMRFSALVVVGEASARQLKFPMQSAKARTLLQRP